MREQVAQFIQHRDGFPANVAHIALTTGASEGAPQHAATHCNTLQHTAKYCNTLQHTAAHCSTLQHTATHCNTLQHTATHTLTNCQYAYPPMPCPRSLKSLMLPLHVSRAICNIDVMSHVRMCHVTQGHVTQMRVRETQSTAAAARVSCHLPYQ